MSKCPFSGEPCSLKKCIHSTHVEKYEAVKIENCCLACGLPLLIEAFDKTGVPGIVKVIEAPPFETPPDLKECDCGITIFDLLKSPKLGCAKCYDTFAEDIRPVVDAVQRGATKHKGKKPKNLPKSADALKEEMHKAIKEENYERAAEIRDKLKDLD